MVDAVALENVDVGGIAVVDGGSGLLFVEVVVDAVVFADIGFGVDVAGLGDYGIVEAMGVGPFVVGAEMVPWSVRVMEIGLVVVVQRVRSGG